MSETESEGADSEVTELPEIVVTAGDVVRITAGPEIWRGEPGAVAGYVKYTITNEGEAEVPFAQTLLRVVDEAGETVYEKEELGGKPLAAGASREGQIYITDTEIADGSYTAQLFVYAGDEYSHQAEKSMYFAGGICFEDILPSGKSEVVLSVMPEVIDGLLEFTVWNTGDVAADPNKERVRLQHRPSGWSWSTESEYEALEAGAEATRSIAVPDDTPAGHIEGAVVVDLLHSPREFDFDFEWGDGTGESAGESAQELDDDSGLIDL